MTLVYFMGGLKLFEFLVVLIIIAIIGFFGSLSYQHRKTQTIQKGALDFSKGTYRKFKEKTGIEFNNVLMSNKKDIAIAVSEELNKIYILKHVPRYKSSAEIIESGITKGMSISESTKLMNDLLTSNILKDDAELKEYDFADLIQSEILEDGVSISKVSNASMLSRVLVGGALAGGVGAIVGGVTSKNISNQMAISIDLKIVMNDMDCPTYTLNILSNVNSYGMEVQQGIPKNAPLYIEMKQLVEQWHGLFSVVINRNEKENNQISSEKSSSDTKYIADELIKLKGLLQEELITKEEFEKQKEKLLT